MAGNLRPVLTTTNESHPMRLPKLRLPTVNLSAPDDEIRAQSLFLRLPDRLVKGIVFGVALFICLCFAWASVLLIERITERAIRSKFLLSGVDWARVDADGMQMHLIGNAPTESERFRAVNIAASVIDSGRLIDDFTVTPLTEIEAPEFSLEMLRNDDGIQLIGLLPRGGAKTALTTVAKDLVGDQPLDNMLETATYEAPATWQAAFDFGVAALELLPRSKISVTVSQVTITAIATSDAEKRRLESELASRLPAGLKTDVTITAPRPVLTPFTFRFVKDANGARFDACSADTERARDRIIAAGDLAGLDANATCTIGLGVPSPRWAEAVEAGIRAINAMGQGTITFSDADVTLLAAEGTPQDVYDFAVGDLQAALPDVFSLDATLPKPTNGQAAGPVEFTATLADTGKVELRGRLADEMQRNAVDSFAKAEFGSEDVYTATRLDPDLPEGWPLRVMAGLQALAELHHGKLVVRGDLVTIEGVTGNPAARGKVSQILSGKLGQGKTFDVKVAYDKELDPIASKPTPQECVAAVNALVAKQKITFAPNSAEIDGSAQGLMNELADALADCDALPMEIAGHTDAQGSDESNRALSQARAEAVLLALQGRRVDVDKMVANGYGESQPIADNETDEGREANRRIEFVLLGDAGGAAQPAATSGSGGTIAARPMPANGATCVKGVQDLLAKEKISFEPGSANISDSSSGLMAAISTLLAQCPGTPIEVAGHTDSQGSESGNQTLSENRAKAVLVALSQAGVDVATIKAVGYGETKPIGDNETEDGREANRRIEFTLLAPPADAPAAPAPADAAAPAAADGAAATGPDFSGDTSPSIAPQEKTIRPKPRPATNG